MSVHSNLDAATQHTHTQRFAPKANETNNNSNYSVVKAIITACMLPSSSSLLLHLHYGILFVYLLHMPNMQLILCIECSHIWQSYAHRRGIGWSVCMFREKQLTINMVIVFVLIMCTFAISWGVAYSENDLWVCDAAIFHLVSFSSSSSSSICNWIFNNEKRVL